MIDIEQAEGVTVLTLNHGKVNAVDIELLDTLAGRLAEIAARSDATAVVITGAGRAFSAGVDLKQVLDGGPEYARRLVPAINGAVMAVLTFPRPVVAAINGAAIAGGCVLSAACDYRVLARGATIGATELVVGVPFPTAALEAVREACGRRADEAVLGAGTYKDEAAAAVGFADELVDADEVLPRAIAMAQQLGAVPPATFRLAKGQLRRPMLDRITALAQLDDEVAAVWASDDTTRVLNDYMERTFGARR